MRGARGSLVSLYFSYNQFLVYDETVGDPFLKWTDRHVTQGFCRQDSVVCFGTLLEFGRAKVRWRLGPFVSRKAYDRAIGVPFLAATGRILVVGLEREEDEDPGRLEIEKGNYFLVAAQEVLEDQDDAGGTEAVDLFFDRRDRPATSSQIIVADDAINTTNRLIESAKTWEW